MLQSVFKMLDYLLNLIFVPHYISVCYVRLTSESINFNNKIFMILFHFLLTDRKDAVPPSELVWIHQEHAGHDGGQGT